MTKPDNQPCWCKCTICLTLDPRGTLQTQRTVRKHCEYNDRKLGLSRGTTWQHASYRTAPDDATQFIEDQWNNDVSGDEFSNEGDVRDDGEMSYYNDRPEEVTEPQDASVRSDFHWLAEEMGVDRGGSLFSSDSEDGGALDDWRFSMDDDISRNDSESDLSSDSEHDHIADITKDPLFYSRHDLFNGDQSDDEDEPTQQDLPPVFGDHPAIRNAYIRAFLGVAFDGMTHKAASLMLTGFFYAFGAGTAGGLDFPGADNFARTIGTVEKRLGVSTAGFIIYLVLCPLCWTTHHPRRLPFLESPCCFNGDCLGTLYTTKRLSDGTEKRTPVLILPYVPPSQAIQRMCLRPGKVAQWQHWRGVGDEPGVRPPTTQKGFDAYDDPDKLLHDVTDAWGWRAIQAGLERRRNGCWEVSDISVLEKAQQFVALPNGLVLQMNIDWYCNLPPSSASV